MALRRRARRRDGDLASRRVRQADRGSRGVQVVIQRPPSPFAALGLITEISSVSAQQVVHREPAGSLLLDQAGPTLAAGEAERTSAERFRQLALTGREPSEVADIAVDAIRAGRFYILTSTNRNEAVRRRAEEILAETHPPCRSRDLARACARQLHPPRPGHPRADLSQERIQRRPVLGGLISEYERAA